MGERADAIRWLEDIDAGWSSRMRTAGNGVACTIMIRSVAGSVSRTGWGVDGPAAFLDAVAMFGVVVGPASIAEFRNDNPDIGGTPETNETHSEAVAELRRREAARSGFVAEFRRAKEERPGVDWSHEVKLWAKAAGMPDEKIHWGADHYTKAAGHLRSALASLDGSFKSAEAVVRSMSVSPDGSTTLIVDVPDADVVSVTPPEREPGSDDDAAVAAVSDGLTGAGLDLTTWARDAGLLPECQGVARVLYDSPADNLSESACKDVRHVMDSFKRPRPVAGGKLYAEARAIKHGSGWDAIRCIYGVGEMEDYPDRIGDWSRDQVGFAFGVMLAKMHIQGVASDIERAADSAEELRDRLSALVNAAITGRGGRVTKEAIRDELNAIQDLTPSRKQIFSMIRADDLDVLREYIDVAESRVPDASVATA